MYIIIASAVLYVGAFIYPLYFNMGVFVYLLPILVHDQDNAYGFKAGCVWGLICFSLHMTWFASVVYTKGKGDTRMLAYIAAVAYFSLYSGFWLWFKQLLVHRWVNQLSTKKGKCVALCCTWVISTASFLYLICYCSLAIFDCFDGYPFLNPLLPLVSCHAYLQPIFILHPLFLWMCIVLCNFSIATMYNKYTNTILIFIIIILLFQSLFWNNYENGFVKNNDIFYLQPAWNNQELTQSQLFYEIGRKLDCVAQHNSKIKYIVMPESSFPYNLIGWEHKLDVWTSLFDDVTIFIGAHRYDNKGKVFNSLYQINDGRIVAYYDKNHLVPFVERIPRWISLFNGLFIINGQTFSYPVHDQSHVIMAEFQPYICSELFYEIKRPALNKPLLFICNDSWLVFNYAQNLAKRCAKLYSLRYNVPVVYVGWYDWGCIL